MKGFPIHNKKQSNNGAGSVQSRHVTTLLVLTLAPPKPSTQRPEINFLRAAHGFKLKFEALRVFAPQSTSEGRMCSEVGIDGRQLWH